MAAKYGYIGNNPDNSPVIVARQMFEPSGITTTFTFAAGYSIGYLDAYLNGAKLIDGQDYFASNGSTIDLTSAATSGDILELVAYKAFNIGNVTEAPGNFTVGGKLTVSGATSATSAVYTGVVTASSFNGNATGLTGTPNIVVGFATVQNNLVVQGNVSVGGTLTYEDVTNVDAIGLITARSGINIVGGGLTVTGVSTFYNNVQVGTAVTFTQSGINVTGIITASSDVKIGTKSVATTGKAIAMAMVFG